MAHGRRAARRWKKLKKPNAHIRLELSGPNGARFFRRLYNKMDRRLAKLHIRKETLAFYDLDLLPCGHTLNGAGYAEEDQEAQGNEA